MTFISEMTKGQKKTELMLYLVLWAILFAAPVVSMYVGNIFTSSSSHVSFEQVSSEGCADWQVVFHAWGLLVMFFVTFAVHNFFIAPLLVFHNRKGAYCASVSALLVCFGAYQIVGRPHHPEPEALGAHKPGIEKPKGKEEMRPEIDSHAEFRPKPPYEPMIKGDGDRLDRPDKQSQEPPRVFGGQDSVAFIIMALLLGLNIGTKYFFKSLGDRKKMKELERENLYRQLEYLKYQINPHFFMNTLNNIHALVDIDPEQAKYTIEVLSKLMRYVLYEGNKTMAPLQKELDFITHYVDLMRIRYTDKVRITVSLPSVSSDGEKLRASLNLMDIQVPSLLFTTFVENAFKHGVSYRKDSFVEVTIQVDEIAQEIEFLCCNSKKPASEDKRGGVGTQNAIKRLQLIYGKEGYELKIDESEEEYRLLLRLPIHSEADKMQIRQTPDSQW